MSSEDESEDELRAKLASLREQHRDLDNKIIALEAGLNADQLAIRRLKKQKLLLKEQIQTVEDELLPDIIA